eukprot:jgi/Bigna1/143728/aug1.81_g18436
MLFASNSYDYRSRSGTLGAHRRTNSMDENEPSKDRAGKEVCVDKKGKVDIDPSMLRNLEEENARLHSLIKMMADKGLGLYSETEKMELKNKALTNEVTTLKENVIKDLEKAVHVRDATIKSKDLIIKGLRDEVSKLEENVEDFQLESERLRACIRSLENKCNNANEESQRPDKSEPLKT